MSGSLWSAMVIAIGLAVVAAVMFGGLSLGRTVGRAIWARIRLAGWRRSRRR